MFVITLIDLNRFFMNPTYLYAFMGAIGILLILIGIFKKRATHQFMEANVDVPQLYLEKSVENKIRTLHHALRQATVTEGAAMEPAFVKRGNLLNAVGEELSKLKEGFRKKEIDLMLYNKKLDALIKRLNQ